MTGLVAHGRGEAFDYLLGERSRPFARAASKAAAAQLLLANQPIISTNGNTSVLVPSEMIELGKALEADIEINLFHEAPSRRSAIKKHFREFGLTRILGVKPDASIRGLTSARGNVDSRGMLSADVVLVSLEDGDRTELLMQNGKKVVAIDLNPFSRTPCKADIPIVDNVSRAIPLITEYVERMKNYSPVRLQRVLDSFDKKKVLKDAEACIRKGKL
ncbi:UNVERIFIED_CONTAM: hypothetical protein GTU68_042833 [Idotea baltica]|nr:hypothetical protein [Idotea baltica]